MSEELTVKGVVIEVATANPIAFQAAMSEVSAELSDEELGRYTRLFMGNLKGANVVEQYESAFEGAETTQRAMVAAAERLLGESVTRLQEVLVKVDEKRDVLRVAMTGQ